MTLKEFLLTNDNHFIGTKSYNFFFKRVMLVLITKNYLIGLVCNNKISVESDEDILINWESHLSSVKRGSFNNPYSYLKAIKVKKIANKYLFDRSIFAVDKSNFRIDRNDVKSAMHKNIKSKHLSNFPSDGTIYIETLKGIKHEFCLLGEQNGKDIIQWILKRQQATISN